MDAMQMEQVKAELKEKFDEIKKQNNLDWKDEFTLIGSLLDDLAKRMPGVPEFVLRSTNK